MTVRIVGTPVTNPGTHTFVCPACRQSIEVDDAMRATLIEAGCAVCGAPVSESDIGEASAVG